MITEARGGGGGGSSGLGVNVRTLGSNLSDWGPTLNNALANGADRLVFPRGDYPYTTPIAAANLNSVIFEGESGRMWYGSGATNGQAPTRLIYKGAGAGNAIDCQGTLAVAFRELELTYDNTAGAFTGSLLKLGGTSNWSLLERCTIGGIFTTSSDFLQTAFAAVDLDNAVCCTIDKCSIGGAQWLVSGQRSAFSHAHHISRSMFRGAALGYFSNIAQRWVIEGNTFEDVENTPIIDSTGNVISYFSFTGNWIGDGNSRFICRRGNPWYAKFRDNFIGGTTGPIWQLQGGGALRITDNDIITSDGNQAIVDLGNVAGGDTAFGLVRIIGNDWVCTLSEAVLNRAGHRQLNVYENGVGAGAYEIRTVSGGRRLGFPDRATAPTVTAGTALGAGGTAAVVSRANDSAGQLVLTPGTGATAGVLCTVTFAGATPSDVTDDGLPPLAKLTPAILDTGVAAGLRVDTTSGNAGFSVYATSAPTGTIYVDYEVEHR